MGSMEKYKILFVCLGNICRSPAAEGVMKGITKDSGLNLEIDSAGLISYHQGENPDSRMMSTARRRGYPLNHKARKIVPQDFDYYDIIIGMDSDNIKKLNQICPEKLRNKIHIASEYFVEVDNYNCVPDPYYGDMDDFDNVISLLEDACKGLLEKIKTEI